MNTCDCSDRNFTVNTTYSPPVSLTFSFAAGVSRYSVVHKLGTLGTSQ